MAEMFEQKKVGREWRDTGNTSTDELFIYKKLAREMISKYIDKGLWVKRIEEDYYYSGDHYKVTVTYDNKYRTIYILEK